MIPYIILIYLAEAIWSWLADLSTLLMLRKKKWKAFLTDLCVGFLAWFVLYAVAKLGDWNVWLICTSVVGVATGRFIIASRKKTKKRSIYRKKFPASTA